MNASGSERLIYSVVLGYVVILNLIGSSYLEFYPTRLLIGAAFGVGIAMVFGSMYFFVRDPKPRKAAVAVTVPVINARRQPFAASA